jgi:hypothetical protein
MSLMASPSHARPTLAPVGTTGLPPGRPEMIKGSVTAYP